MTSVVLIKPPQAFRNINYEIVRRQEIDLYLRNAAKVAANAFVFLQSSKERARRSGERGARSEERG